jgi:invasion protein IalB
MVDGQTVTVTYGATATADTAIGVMTFPTGVAAKGVFVKNPTTGNTVMAEGGFLKFETSDTAGAVVQVDLDIELDPYAR